MAGWRGTRARSLGDAEAELVGQLYDDHGAALQAYAQRFVGDPDRAADLVQEVMLRAWKNPEKIHPRTGDPRAWLYTVARNVLTDWHRAQQRRPEFLTAPEELPELAQLDVELDRALEAWQMSEALGRLTPDHRAVLQEVYYRGRSTAQAAETLGVPVGTVKSRTHHALARLRAVLEEMGVQP
ncbi:MAG: sigma-70 family RNA polymerase sigma factor [Pseudorhodobacter sp.]|nr:sigma-70 family RNA polymerase sigma factor [Frankiaceae bacterium]